MSSPVIFYEGIDPRFLTGPRIQHRSVSIPTRASKWAFSATNIAITFPVGSTIYVGAGGIGPYVRMRVVEVSGTNAVIAEDFPNSTYPTPYANRINFTSNIVGATPGASTFTATAGAKNAPGLDTSGAIALWWFNPVSDLTVPGGANSVVGTRRVGGPEWELSGQGTYQAPGTAPTGRTFIRRVSGALTLRTAQHAAIASALEDSQGVTIEALMNHAGQVGGTHGWGANGGSGGMVFGLPGSVSNVYTDCVRALGASMTPAYGVVATAWQHLAMTYKPGSLAVHINGVQIGATDTDPRTQTFGGNAAFYVLGSQSATAADIRLAEMRITSGIRTAAELLEQARRCGVAA